MSSLGGYVSQHLSNKWTEDSKKMPSPTGPLGPNGILGRTRSRPAWLCRLRDAPPGTCPHPVGGSMDIGLPGPSYR